jgi:gamma-glutamyl hercynylcysteine S-oxide synthase
VTARETLARELTKARDRTLRLVDFDDAELRRQHDPLMSPLVWDLAHIGQQEELWLLRDGNPDRPGMLPPDVERLYDAFENSRAIRVQLPLLPPADARAYCATVRDRALDNLDALPDDAEDAAFRFGLVISHENQHDETMLQALNLRSGPPLLGAGSSLPPGRSGVVGTSALVPAGEFVLGVDAVSEPHSLDNERPAHVVDVPAFRIGRVPVTNGEWRQFIDDGGYHQQRWWSDRGWTHRQEAGLTAPQFWNPDGTRVRFGQVEDIPADEPVQHVTYFEAEAYAAWAGARLPSEVEWEKAATWDPAVGKRRRFPWGASEPTEHLANLGRSGPTRQAPPPTAPNRCLATCGSGRRRRCGRGRASRRWSTTGIRSRFSKVLGLATTGCCAAAHGRWRRASCGPASATGTTRSGGRSSRACAWPGTPDVPTPRLARRTAIDRVAGARPTIGAAGAVVCAPTAEARPDERRRMGRRVLRQWRGATVAWRRAPVG